MADQFNMPQVGLGLWKVEPEKAAGVVEQAIETGYRHIDEAADYGNEQEAGRGIENAINKGLCRREDLWVTSKLWNTYHRPEHVKPALQKTLDDLGLDYLDLYLMHFPLALEYVPFDKSYPPGWTQQENGKDVLKIDRVSVYETWKAMEELVDEGLVKHIGVSNFSLALLNDLLASVRIRPANLQIEMHPYLTQERFVQFCDNEDISLTAYSPLGTLSYVPMDLDGGVKSVLEHDAIKMAAEHHNKSAVQIVLRWGVQRGAHVITKSTNPDHLKDNLEVMNFELTGEEMTAISHLNRNLRFNDPRVYKEDDEGRIPPVFDI